MAQDEYVKAYQHGRSGIYPHKVADDLAAEYGISLAEAREIVLRHIFDELRAADSLPDGYNGHTVELYAEPIRRDGDHVLLRCAEPGREFLVRWARIDDLVAA